RNAPVDTLSIMTAEGAPEIGGVMHCFTESLSVAHQTMTLNVQISFSGIVTFKNAKDLKLVAREVPIQRLMIETDSPYLAPVPHRGKTNEPAYVRHVAAEIAEIKNLPLERVGELTSANFFSLFNVRH